MEYFRGWLDITGEGVGVEKFMKSAVETKPRDRDQGTMRRACRGGAADGSPSTLPGGGATINCTWSHANASDGRCNAAA